MHGMLCLQRGCHEHQEIGHRTKGHNVRKYEGVREGSRVKFVVVYHTNGIHHTIRVTSMLVAAVGERRRNFIIYMSDEFMHGEGKAKYGSRYGRA